MKKLSFVLVAFTVLLSCVIPVGAASPNLDCQSCVLLDSKTGQIIYEQNPDERLYPASVTKMMTAVIAIEKGDPNQMMTASQAAVNDIGVDGMNIGIMAGEQLRLEDLLNALLVRSANETANIIAENICPTRKAFVDLMNQKARELGAVHTNFVNPCGAHNPNHYSTAGDMAIIARYAMTLPKFSEIVCQPSYKMHPTNKHDSWPILPTTNKLLKQKSDFFSRVIGTKTGYTSQAGHNLVSAAVNNDGMELIAVVMGVRGDGSEVNIFNYSKNLLEYGFQKYSMQKFVDAGQAVKSMQVANAAGDGSLDLITANELKAALPVDKSAWNIEKKEYLSSTANAPVKQGDVLGYVEYTRNGTLLGRVNVIASRPVEKSVPARVVDTAKQTASTPLLKRILLGAAGALVVFILLRSILRRVSAKRISRTAPARRQENE